MDASDTMDFPDAVALAWRIRRAGYEVEALSCREDGGRCGWYVLHLGEPWDSRIYKVRSADEWEQWLGRHERKHLGG